MGSLNQAGTLTRSQFSYSVPWDNVSTDLKGHLELCQRTGQQADANKINQLKKWIGEDLFNKYEEFKSRHIVKFKTPGIVIYEAVTLDVTTRFPNCFQVVANDADIDDGYSTFLQNFTHHMEHKGRKAAPVPRRVPQARIARGAVGVVEGMYNPSLRRNETEEQEELQEKLQDIYKTVGERQWSHQEIDRLMHQSYALQRHDIVNAMKEVAEAEVDDPQGLVKLSEVQQKWPFLFYQRWQKQHFQLLTGNTIDLALLDYKDNFMELLIDFLTSCGTQSSLTNIVLHRQWQKNGSNVNVQFLLAMKMLANHFQEHNGVLYLTAEKTTPPSEIKFLPGVSGEPAIIALDQNVFQAKKFYAIIDQHVVLETNTSEEALIGLISAAFMFDVQYPISLRHTFEYIERVVCRLGNMSRCPGALAVTTPLVLKLISDLRKFQEQFELSTILVLEGNA